MITNLAFTVVPHNNGLQWLCKSTNFEVKGTVRPHVEGVCTVHTGQLAEHHARAEALRANA